MEKRASELLFHAISVLTDIAPESGARFLDALITGTMGNARLLKREAGANQKRLARAEALKRVLFVADVNIGDAVMTQAGISAVRDFFPEAVLDYAIGRTGASLVEGNPEITTLHPIFERAPEPEPAGVRRLEALLHHGDYDLVINFCPYLGRRWLSRHTRAVIDWGLLGGKLIAGSTQPESTNHVIFRAHHFIHSLFRLRCSPRRRTPLRGVELRLSPDAIERAQDFLLAHGLLDGRPLLLYNPDATSPYTRLPFDWQVSLLGKLTALPGHGLIAAGFSEPGVERQLLEKLDPAMRSHWTPTPTSLPIDAFAALVDHCELYLSPDTGQLHLAAARKRSRNGVHEFRNRTAVYGIFGATPARIYGYDSRFLGYLPANQDAPSHAYAGTPPCRNLSCINKAVKACRNVRCFEGLDLDELVTDAAGHLANAEWLKRKPTG